MTYFIAASLPEGHPAKEEVVRILRKFKIRFDGSTNPERVKNFIDLQSVASSAAVTPRENAIGKATKPIRAVYRIGFPSTSAASASTSREVLERAPVEQMERFGQSPPMATDGNECFDQEDDDEDDPLQHILKVCNKRAEQIEQQRSLGKVMVAEERRLPMNGYAPAEVKQEEGIADVIEGETKPPVLNQEEIEREDEPLVVKEEEPEAEDDVMDVPPERKLSPIHAVSIPSAADFSSPFPCMECGAPFHTRRGLSCHQVVHDPAFIEKQSKMQPKAVPKKRRFKCSRCSQTFMVYSALQRHEKKHREQEMDSVECNICGKSFLKLEQVKFHMELMHPDETYEARFPQMTLERFECDKCTNFYFSGWELEHHQKQRHGMGGN